MIYIYFLGFIIVLIALYLDNKEAFGKNDFKTPIHIALAFALFSWIALIAIVVVKFIFYIQMSKFYKEINNIFMDNETKN